MRTSEVHFEPDELDEELSFANTACGSSPIVSEEAKTPANICFIFIPNTLLV
jgi:hypothetical protein